MAQEPADAAPATVLVAAGDEQVGEVVARIVEATGRTAVRLGRDARPVDEVLASGADGLVLDLGAGNLAALEQLRAAAEPAAQAVRVVVVGTGPAGGRLAWQAGADGFLARPFHARDLQAALAEALAPTDDEARAAHRAAGLQALAS